MPSSFPGLDPFIEAQDRWHSFHTGFIVACSRILNQRLPENYYATVEERVLLDATDAEESPRRVFHRLGPDAAISREPAESLASAANVEKGVVATLQPRTLPQSIISIDQPTQKFVEIRGLPNHVLVTTIELLSPTNKRAGEDRAAYLAKRADLLRHDVNVVDLDFLLAGQRLPLLVPLPAGDFHAFVTRAAVASECEVYSWSVRDSLPAISIPLKATEGDVALNLQEAFNQVYDEGRYRGLIQYDQPMPTGLSEGDREWVAARIKPRS